MAAPISVIPAPSTLLPLAERKRILSSSRLKLSLTAFIALLLAALCTFVILLVTHIFHWLTPTIRQDLAWKVSQGAAEVAEHAEIGMLLKDGPVIRDAFEHYAADDDVQAIVVTDATGTILALQGELPGPLNEFFSGPERRLNVSDDYISAWASHSVEGALVGRVAMIASTARLDAGEDLRKRLLWLTAIAGVGGLALSLSFVTLYVGPVLRVTGRAFEGLERAAREMAKKERLEKELEIGARIQTCLLPDAIAIPGLEVAARMTPASEVGGDYYDAFSVPGGAFIGIGDVAGHGLTSGLVMLMVQSVVAALGRSNADPSPRDIVNALNTVLYDNIRNRLRNKEHVTFTLFRYFDGGRFTFAGAHEELLIYRERTREVEYMATPGTWLGAMKDISKFTTDSELRLEAGDLLVLYTDGVTEAMNEKREQFGLERLAELVKAKADLPTERLCNEIHDSVFSWCNQAADDDVTLLIARYRG
jgi:serine phosphatase RsbU (regulator of sigma subunit)